MTLIISKQNEIINEGRSYVGSDVQIPFSCFWVLAQELVDESVEFHQTTILTQVIL